VPWDHPPLLTTLARQVGDDLGKADGVIVFDPSASAKKGAQSVGVARQWCRRLDNHHSRKILPRLKDQLRM